MNKTMHPLTTAVELLIAVQAAWDHAMQDSGGSPLNEKHMIQTLAFLGEAAKRHMGSPKRRASSGWQEKLRAQAARVLSLDCEPEELGLWEHCTTPMGSADFEEHRQALEGANSPSTEGHRRTLVAARRLWDEAHRRREQLALADAALLKAQDTANAWKKSAEALRPAAELGVEKSDGSERRAEETIAELRRNTATLGRIATALERAAGVQEWALQHPGRRWGEPPLDGFFDEGEFRALTSPCPKCGCRLAVSGTESTMAPCPACGSYRRGGTADKPEPTEKP